MENKIKIILEKITSFILVAALCSSTIFSAGFFPAAAKNAVKAAAGFTMPVEDVTALAVFELTSPEGNWQDEGNYDTAWYDAALSSFTLNTPAELAGLARLVNNGNNFLGRTVKAGGDIVLSQHYWTAIGDGNNSFRGTFDGQDYKIIGLYLDTTERSQGLFGVNYSLGIIRNIGITMGDIAGGDSTGAIVGLNMGRLQNCYNMASVKGASDVGGIAGENLSGALIENCYNSGDVSGLLATGGIAGVNNTATIQNCYNSGNVDSDHVLTGGIVGSNITSVIACYWLKNDEVNTNLNSAVGNNAGARISLGSFSSPLDRLVATDGSELIYGDTLLDALNFWIGEMHSSTPTLLFWACRLGENRELPVFTRDIPVKLTGMIRSENPGKPITIELWQDEKPIYGATIKATEGYGPVEQPFSFRYLAPGNYRMVISKAVHSKFTVQSIVVGDKDLDLTEDSRPEVRMMTLRCGDINGDGLINDADLTVLWRAGNYNRKVGDADNELCDLNGDGLINDADLTILWQAYNYNRGPIIIEPLPELDSELISISVNGEAYTDSSAVVTLITDQVFPFSVTLKNRGTGTWGQYYDDGERGATLFSRGPDYNENFGTFFLSPGQSVQVKSGELFTYNMSLRAPAEPGLYTMTWQLADWIIPYIYIYGMEDYRTRPFYGDPVTVNLIVMPRTEEPPAKPGRLPGVIDEFDFEYEGSFSLPAVPGVFHDEKAFFEGGITLRTVNGEKRLILATGTYEQSLYEIAIPTPGKFAGSDAAAVPVAQLRTVFGALPKYDGYTENGTIWYDESADLLYWTNYHGYYTNHRIEFPVLRSARLGDGVLTEVQQWYQPEAIGDAPLKSFWGGVTTIPDSFAQKYTGGRKLALGFGGIYSINSTASWGPSFAAVLPDSQKADLDLLPVIFSSIDKRTVRDGNYFYAGISSDNPLNPWQGSWSGSDSVKSGVFIDLPGKKGYITFVNQAIGRIGYDYGGANWNGKMQNCWYFYDFDTLGKAALGEISGVSLAPSSIAIKEYPNDLTKDKQYVTGSCFDPESGRLYLYTLGALKRNSIYNEPVVHVYTISK